MTVELRTGEELVHCAGGAKCCVCKGPIPKGEAVQLSKWTSRLRHVECMPKRDTRQGIGGTFRRGRKILPE